MDPGVAGGDVTDTITVLALLVPHVFVAVTEIVPPVAPAVASIDVVEGVPIHPDGKVHEYVLAPGTSNIL